MKSFIVSIFLISGIYAQQIDYNQQVRNKPITRASDFTFTRTNGLSAVGNLTTPGAMLVSVTSCPFGLDLSSGNHYVYISGGTGTAESVLITGGTCTSGAAMGTLQFTTSNAHTGAWTITSATAGIKEAIVSLGSAGGEVIIPSGTNTIYSPIVITISNVTLRGTGAASVIHNAGTGKAIDVEGTSDTLSGVNLHNLSVTGTASSGDGIFYFSAVSCHIVNVASTGNGGDGLRVERFLLGTVVGGRYTSNTGWGISLRRNLDGSNSNTIVSASVQYNTAGGVNIAQSDGVRLYGGDIENNGGFGGVYLSGAYKTVIDGVWFEGNINHDLYAVKNTIYNVLGPSVVNNFFVDNIADINFENCEGGYMAGNTISGAVSIGSDCSNFVIGPQTRILGTVTDNGSGTVNLYNPTSFYWKYGGVQRLGMGANISRGYFSSDLELTSVINGQMRWTVDSNGVGPADMLFANLPTPGAGKRRILYCTDCAVTSPCTGSGTGAWAFYNGSSWKCPF